MTALAVTAALLGCGTDGQSEPDALRLLSDRSVVFTVTGETRQARVEAVDADGAPLEVDLEWTSSAPEEISVDSEGEIAALAPRGSALITARHGNLHVRMSAVVVTLTEDAVLVDSEDVIDVSPEEILLRTTESTRAIAAGNVVVNGGVPGFLARVQAVASVRDDIVLTVEAAAITDAIAEMDVSFRAEAEVPEALRDDGDSVSDGEGGAGGSAPDAKPNVQPLTVPLQCKASNGSLVNVSVTSFNYRPRLGLSTEFQLRIRQGAVELLVLALTGDFGIDAGVGEVKVTGGVRGKVECKVSLTAIPFAAIPILGPVMVAATAKPKTGVEMKLDYAAVELSLNGATTKKAVRIRTGVGYEPEQGFRLIGEVTTLEDDVDLLAARRRPDAAFTASVEPFFGFEFGFAATLGPIPIVEVGLLSSKAFGGYELDVTVPLSPQELQYRGPRWNAYVGVDADVDPLLDHLALFERFLAIFGLQGAQSLVGVSAKLFEAKLVLAESPAPTITPSPRVVSNGQNVTFTYGGLGTGVGARLEGHLADGASMRRFGQLQTSGGGTERLAWTPSSNDTGTHAAIVRVYDGIFGTVGLPYASETRPTVEVRCTAPQCPTTNPPPPPPSPVGPCMVDGPNGSRVFAPGAGYTTSRRQINELRLTDGSIRLQHDLTRNFQALHLGGGTWQMTRTETNAVLGQTSTGTAERQGPGDGGVRPWCDEAGTLHGASGTLQTVRRVDNDNLSVQTVTWEAFGCHPWFLDQQWACERSPNNGRYYPVDLNQ
ncbi:MAG: hypothetical protein AAF997_08575 [Myxococcota bacterium]